MNGFETITPFLKPIEHLLVDNSVSEIMVNGGDHVFFEKNGYLERAEGVSLTDRALLVAVKNIARRLGSDISEANPILDSRLPDGSRVAAVIPPCSLNGVVLTIRKFNSRRWETPDLVHAGTLDQALASRLEDYVLRRKNILLAGATSTGKSTALAALATFIPQDDRILLIEDTAEIRLAHGNLVRLEARREQAGVEPVTIRHLLKAALRHRPDRIVLGEVRGGEAFELLQLLNTGHSGTLSTIHASSAAQALGRFAHCVLESDAQLPHRSIKAAIADSVNVIVHLERRPGRRYVKQVVEIKGYDPDADRFDLSIVFHDENTRPRQIPDLIHEPTESLSPTGDQ
jgi:pilus assembly protein CpaF